MSPNWNNTVVGSLPILEQMTTIKLATGWLSSTIIVLTVPSSILTFRVRIFLRYSTMS